MGTVQPGCKIRFKNLYIIFDIIYVDLCFPSEDIKNWRTASGKGAARLRVVWVGHPPSTVTHLPLWILCVCVHYLL